MLTNATPAMRHVSITRTPPPPNLLHDPNICDDNGHTIAMIWVRCVRNNPQIWMRHDPKLKDSNGWPIGFWWIMSTRTWPLDWMIDKSDMDILIAFWKRHMKTDPPI